MAVTRTGRKRRNSGEPAIKDPKKHPKRPPISDPPARPKRPAPIKEPPTKR
jgi:hypothetical protein